jgi:hypothetical protein
VRASGETSACIQRDECAQITRSSDSGESRYAPVAEVRESGRDAASSGSSSARPSVGSVKLQRADGERARQRCRASERIHNHECTLLKNVAQPEEQLTSAAWQHTPWKPHEQTYLGPRVIVNTMVSVNIAYTGEEGTTHRGAQRCVQTVRTTSVGMSHTMSIQVACMGVHAHSALTRIAVHKQGWALVRLVRARCPDAQSTARR